MPNFSLQPMFMNSCFVVLPSRAKSVETLRDNFASWCILIEPLSLMLDGFSPATEAVLNCLVHEWNDWSLCATSQFPFPLSITFKSLLLLPLSLKGVSPGLSILCHAAASTRGWQARYRQGGAAHTVPWATGRHQGQSHVLVRMCTLQSHLAEIQL